MREQRTRKAAMFAERQTRRLTRQPYFGCRSYTFLKIRQPNKISIFEAAEFVHGSAHVNKRRLRTQTRRLTRQPYLVAEVIPFLSLHLLKNGLSLLLRMNIEYEVC